MKYLDENGLRRFWKKTKEYIEMNGGSGGGGGTSYFEKEYTVGGMEIANPLYYMGSVDSPENVGQDAIITETLKKYYFLEEGEKIHLFEDGNDSGYYTAKAMTANEMTILTSVLQTYDPSFQLLQISYGAYISKNDTPLMDLISGIPVGTTIITLKGDLVFPTETGEARLPMLMLLYCNQVTSNEKTMIKLNKIFKLPVKSFLSQEPVLLWEGNDNTYSPIITTDCLSKFRFLSVVYYDDSDPSTLKTVSSIIIDDTATFVINFTDGEDDENYILTFNLMYPNNIVMSCNDNMSKIHIIQVYGSY